MILLNIDLNYLDIWIELWNVREQALGVFLHTLDKHLASISRDPDEMVFGLIDGMGTLF